MAKKNEHGRFPPFSLRLSFDERAQLQQAAGNMALGAYIREKLLTTPEERKAVRQAPTEDRKILGQLLAVLGKAHLANNLNQLAKAVNSGSLDVTPDTERMIRECYAEVMWMRQMLIEGLGLKPKGRK
jgi:hypothetical protein